jgi:hypothetical protein
MVWLVCLLLLVYCFLFVVSRFLCLMFVAAVVAGVDDVAPSLSVSCVRSLCRKLIINSGSLKLSSRFTETLITVRMEIVKTLIQVH